jgi:Flp pilus assembly CpaF family ATPase
VSGTGNQLRTSYPPETLGSRAHAIVPPLSLRGPTLTIRKFSPVPLRAEDLVRGGTAGPRMLRGKPADGRSVDR